jgi:DNA-binding LytR/AlgR family response regulator
MRVLIVEDENLAAKRLGNFLKKYSSKIEICKVLDTVEDAIDWISGNTVDLIFLDIHLSDANSLEIFKHIKIEQPIIFTTAYDNYAVKAFEANAVAYLLKPYSFEELEKAIEKAEKFFLNKASKKAEDNFAKRLLFETPNGEKSIPIEASDIAYLRSEDRFTYAVQFNGILSKTNEPMAELELRLNPNLFFRVNRSFIVNFNAIESVKTETRSRLAIQLKIDCPYQITSSTAKTAEFKAWLNR